ncbi:AAA family ATPase [Anabaena sp. PCC 7108]|uniref:nucleotide-binding protein n=1 Tax=Anabaena sp. PCC 7108 TaxID=163908 RepID=UPI00034DF65B|nr:AAA family ATPase [Anabaena sp. PCC 7108]
MVTFESASDFEKVVALLLTQAGWKITMPPANTKGYDIEAVKGSEVLAVQVKNYKTSVKIPQLEKFIDFLELPIAAKFTKGLFVTSSVYSSQALTYFEQINNDKIRLAVFKEGNLTWTSRDKDGNLIWRGVDGPIEPPPEIIPPTKKLTYFGVFTCKGGVGKTTVSAHLAGAFALSGYDVALIDLDPQQNLTTLLGEGVKLSNKKNSPGNTVTVYNVDEWDDENPPDDVKMVICDCSPVLDKNPPEILKKLSYCIIPTTLNPLGLNKNGHVIQETLKAIRSINKDAYLFVLINNYFPDENKRSQVLKYQYQLYFDELSQQDSRFKFIDPDQVAIRNSKQLFYWGYHIYDGSRSELAFTPIGGRCLPKADFLNLLEYLEEHSDIESLRNT